MSSYRFSLYLDPEIMEHIKASAEKNRRSINKEIEFAILQYLESEKKSAE